MSSLSIRQTIRYILLCALLIAHTPAQPTFNLELPDAYTTVACFISCCIGAFIYGIMHHYCCRTPEIKPNKQPPEKKLAPLQKLLEQLQTNIETLQTNIQTVQTEQKKIATFILKEQMTNIANVREDLRVLAHQTGINIKQHTELLNGIDTCFQNNKNTMPITMAGAYYWRNKYIEQTKELKKYTAQSGNTAIALDATQQ